MKTVLNLDKNHKKIIKSPNNLNRNQEFQYSHSKITLKALEIQEHSIRITQITDSKQLELSNF